MHHDQFTSSFFFLPRKVSFVDIQVFMRLQTGRYDLDRLEHLFYFCTIQASWSAIATKVSFPPSATLRRRAMRWAWEGRGSPLGDASHWWDCRWYHQFWLLLGCFWNIRGPKTMSRCGGPLRQSDILLLRAESAPKAWIGLGVHSS